MKIIVKNEPSTSALAELQLANASTTLSPLNKPPVYNIATIHETIRNTIGRTKSLTLPFPTTSISSELPFSLLCPFPRTSSF